MKLKSLNSMTLPLWGISAVKSNFGFFTSAITSSKSLKNFFCHFIIIRWPETIRPFRRYPCGIKCVSQNIFLGESHMLKLFVYRTCSSLWTSIAAFRFNTFSNVACAWRPFNNSINFFRNALSSMVIKASLCLPND